VFNYLPEAPGADNDQGDAQGVASEKNHTSNLSEDEYL
jgi:hypothetical protein